MGNLFMGQCPAFTLQLGRMKKETLKIKKYGKASYIVSESDSSLFNVRKDLHRMFLILRILICYMFNIKACILSNI